jgi:hypothetical protein
MFFQVSFALTIVNNMFTIPLMIRTFADTETERFYATGKSRRFPPDVLKRAIKRLTQLDAAMAVEAYDVEIIDYH